MGQVSRIQEDAISSRLESAYRWNRGGEYSHHAYLWPTVKSMLPRTRRLRILDAGCGSGFIAAQLTAMNHEVIGIDASPSGIELARRTYPGIRFELTSVYDDLAALSPSGGWDLIISLEVIEHLFSPKRFLENVKNSLTSRGMLLLSTPYHGYMKNLTLSVTNTWDRHHTVDWECGHIKFFSAKTLTRALEDAGFHPSTIRYSGRVPLFWKSMICLSSRSR
jgi:2-polyprenyl-3-methyl-5-hydroxy-6-metoxy-1,4-benzoquinol methylase